MTLEINLQVPTGKDYLVNGSIRVCSTGRIRLEYPTIITKIEEDKSNVGDVILHTLNSRHECQLVIENKQLESIAYTLLGIVAAHNQRKTSSK